jgi:DNA-binding transcriptional LysR family regulator
VRLTPAGEAFLHHARGILRQTEQLQLDMRDYARGLRGHVRIHANTTAVTDILPIVLTEFLQANPKVNVELQERQNPEIAQAVLDARADIGIVSTRMQVPGLRTIHFSTDRLVLVVPKGHRLARRKSISLAATLDESHVGMHAGSTLREHLSQVTALLGRQLHFRVELASFDAMCRMVAAGLRGWPPDCRGHHSHRGQFVAPRSAWRVPHDGQSGFPMVTTAPPMKNPPKRA